MESRKNPFNVVGQLAALRRYARSLARDPDDAEDLVHDALVKAYERKATFRTGANIRNWLLSILHNTHIDRLRRQRSTDRRHDEASQVAETSAPADQDHSLRLKQVQAAFFALPEEQREALHLVAIEELSYQEAAAVLNIPVGTLMSRISRARAKLRSFEEGEAGIQARHLRLIGGSGDGNH
ncbi:MAG: sigma-70 family RNA polymerase sigma factor [Shinella sp.]|jgi:RNA polymerase sigma-70 factor, ECF subfamily|nr:sigma-70 family RNA polymerase sigma factor [Shinella sp.]